MPPLSNLSLTDKLSFADHRILLTRGGTAQEPYGPAHAHACVHGLITVTPATSNGLASTSSFCHQRGIGLGAGQVNRQHTAGEQGQYALFQILLQACTPLSGRQ